ncbi:hypothetical protein [Streptomyces sp. S584]|uniref:hypothetical protein n=1 Tax=Streptomyces sp. S584 TaxID=3096010 RepID=UPI002AFE1EDB|nr:hypothetical protein [Streptomyces sp. S584]
MTENLTAARATADTAVAAAVQEADEAANLAQALEERVRNGDDTITPEQIANARELGQFAQLRADATRRKAEQAKRAARLADLTQLKADIDAHTETTDTDQLVDNIFEALLAYTQHFDAHNTRVNQWRARMTELGVPKVMSTAHLSADDAHLGRNGHDLYVGDTVYAPVDHKGHMPYQLEQLGAAIRYIASHPSGPRHEQARANAQEHIDRVKATARAGARTQKGHSA